MIAAHILAAALANAPLVLEAAGLGTSGGRHLRFGITEGAAVTAATAVLGTPLRRGTYPDCGQGIPMGHIHYRGGLELSFIRHRFVGWTLDEGGDARWRSAKGIGLGSSLTALRAADREVSLDDYADAVRFSSETGPSGFLSGKGARAKVTALHAGQTCIVD